MTEERDKRGPKESSSRNTARDVPLVRGAGSESEPAPPGQRPAQLPRDPTYEAELAQVEFAVLRDRERRVDPSTKPGGGRDHQFTLGHPPESVTPESPQARGSEVARGRSPAPPSSGGRAVASGTLLSVGAVDPRGKTERTLETPRMFISQPHQSGEAYFKPGKIPSVTVHQTLETETVKLSDSIDPRRAKTIPRLDRAALARLAELEEVPDSEEPMAVSQPPGSLDVVASDVSARFNQQEYEPVSSLGERGDGQIHASLSQFRDQAEPSFALDGVPTRPEPLAARRPSAPPDSPPVPDTSTVPTQRDLPMHRIEASRPPPAPAHGTLASAPASAAGDHSESEGPRAMTASIAGEEPHSRPLGVSLAAFAGALLLVVLLGWLVTSRLQASKQATPDASPSAVPVAAPAVHPEPAPAATVVEPAPNGAPQPTAKAPEVTNAPAHAPPQLAATPAAPATAVVATPKTTAGTAPRSAPASVTPSAAPAAPRQSSSPSKSPHETIF